MEESTNKPQENHRNSTRQVVFGISAVFISIVLLLILLAIIAPGAFLVVINVIWLILLGIVVLFLLLGVLVLIGMRKEVTGILNILLEGSLSLIDLGSFLKHLIKNFIEMLKEFLLILTPTLSYILGLGVYFMLLYLYKFIGKDNDVTMLTVILTVSMVAIVGVLSRNNDIRNSDSWSQKFFKGFKDYFGDAIEVVILLFFLTMDLKIFFLPSEFQKPLEAQIDSYDLMTRSFVIDDHIRTTLTLILVTIAIEILRFLMRLVVGSLEIYKQTKAGISVTYRTSELIKHALRESFKANRDDIIKFLAFTTVLILVFLIFPRLKLFAMVLTSITVLLLDLIFQDRLKLKRQDDLLGKVISKVFKL